MGQPTLQQKTVPEPMTVIIQPAELPRSNYLIPILGGFLGPLAVGVLLWRLRKSTQTPKPRRPHHESTPER